MSVLITTSEHLKKCTNTRICTPIACCINAKKKMCMNTLKYSLNKLQMTSSAPHFFELCTWGERIIYHIIYQQWWASRKRRIRRKINDLLLPILINFLFWLLFNFNFNLYVVFLFLLDFFFCFCYVRGTNLKWRPVRDGDLKAASQCARRVLELLGLFSLRLFLNHKNIKPLYNNFNVLKLKP